MLIFFSVLEWAIFLYIAYVAGRAVKRRYPKLKNSPNTRQIIILSFFVLCFSLFYGLNYAFIFFSDDYQSMNEAFGEIYLKKAFMNAIVCMFVFRSGIKSTLGKEGD